MTKLECTARARLANFMPLGGGLFSRSFYKDDGEFVGKVIAAVERAEDGYALMLKQQRFRYGDAVDYNILIVG